MRLLLTGFRPFPGVPTNLSEQLITQLDPQGLNSPSLILKTHLLNTEYQTCEQQFSQLMSDFQPDLIWSFGVSRRAPAIKFERLAVNIDDSATPDSAGEVRLGQQIDPAGPVAYLTTAPLETTYQVAKATGLPVKTSVSAGSYVCNHWLYVGLHWLAMHQSSTRLGFIHLPMAETLTELVPNQSPESVLQHLVEAVVSSLVQE